MMRKEREPKPKVNGLGSLSFPILMVGELAVLCPEGEQALGERLIADRRHLRPGQDEALQGGLDDAITRAAWTQQYP